MKPHPDQLLEQLSRLKATELPDGFEAKLHERLVAVSQQSGAVILPLRRPRRKATLVLVAALSVPFAAAAASGVLSHYWHGEAAKSSPSAGEPANTKAAAARKRSTPRPAAPASCAPTQIAEPAASGAPAPESGPSHGAAEPAKRPSTAATGKGSEEPRARTPVPRAPSGAAAAHDALASETTPSAGKPAPAADTMPASADAKPKSTPLEQLDLPWPGSGVQPLAGTKAGTSTGSSPAPAVTPATTGLRRAGHEQNLGERDRVQNREARGRTEAGRWGAGSDRAQRGGAAQQRQMSQTKRGQ